MIPIRDENPTEMTPYVTGVFILFNVLIWVLVQGAGAPAALESSVHAFGTKPCEITGACPVEGNPNIRAQFLQKSIEYWKQRGNPPVYAAYFNLDWEPTCDYRLDADASATLLWKTAVTNGLDAF